MKMWAIAALCAAIVVWASAPAWAQSGSAKADLSGTVVDSGGGVLPGATVDVKNNATGVLSTTVTNSTGAFAVPALDAGAYTVTVSLQGFKTSVTTDVQLVTATPRSLKVTLEVGALSQTVEVKGGAQLVQTQSTTISSTINADKIQNLPLVTRNALNFVVFLPGVDTSANNHLQRSSTIMGLPQSAISISIDGVNVQDNYTKTNDGFFANIRPQLDMVEEVTVSSATPSADSSGQGAVQIKFVTRSGSNKFEGSAYEYFRNPALNTNNYFNIKNNLPKNDVRLNQFGARAGGPIVIPGLVNGHDRAFYFVNYEEFRLPSTNTRTRTILSPLAQQGIFQYSVAGAVQSVDLLALAAKNGQTGTFDPTVQNVLAEIRSSTQAGGTINQRTDPNLQDYLWQPSASRIEHIPSTRVDVNLSKNNRLSSSYTIQLTNSTPDLFNNNEARFPGLPNFGSQKTFRNQGATTLRSTLGSHLVNEVRFGFTWSPVYFSDGLSPDEFADQGGFSLGFPSINGVTPTAATTTRAFSARNGKSWNLDDTVNWLKGKHTMQFGESFTSVNGWSTAQNVVPTIGFGVDQTNDPANALFTTANFPGAANADLTTARNLYAFLTGRVTSVGSEVRLDGATGKYVYMGLGRTVDTQNEVGLFFQDSWRLRPNVTVNGGVRWELALPFHAGTSVYSMNTFDDLCGVSGRGNGPLGRGCNLFNPGVFNNGQVPVYEPYDANSPGFNTDYNNFAPNIGIAWQPEVEHGFLRTILGDPTQATIRASYGVSYNAEGLSFYTGVYSGNPGNTVTTTRTTTSAQFPLVLPGETYPVLFRDQSRLGPSANNPVAPAYPMPINFSSGVSIFDPNFQTPFTRSFSIGLQRGLSKDMVVEVRYVGTRLVEGTTTEEWNQINFTSNGFLSEFKKAQQNLQVAIAQGCGQTGKPACSFAYQGPGTGTSPLPIYLANYVGSAASDNAASYTGTQWTNTTNIGRLAQLNPNPGSAASDLFGNATFRANAIAAGLPSNFFVLNPDVSSATILTNGASTKYDSLQIDMRRALSRGLEVDANYVYSRRYSSALDDLRRERTLVRSTDGVPHAIKLTVNYDLPFGRQRRWGANFGKIVDGALGGWSVNVTGRVQSGTTLDFGNVRVVGMSLQDLQKAYHVDIRNDANGKSTVYMLPQDIIDNTIKAFSTSATSATGYGSLGAPSGRYLAPANGPDCIQEVRGDCAPRDVFVQGPVFTSFNLAAKKRITFARSRSIDLEYDMLNIFNAINFTPVAQTGTSATINQVTNQYQDINVTFDPGGRVGQIVLRINF